MRYGASASCNKRLDTAAASCVVVGYARPLYGGGGGGGGGGDGGGTSGQRMVGRVNVGARRGVLLWIGPPWVLTSFGG
jgi:hypothetical protein